MGDEYDSVMNYPLMSGIHDFFLDEQDTKEDFEYMINRCYTMYMQQCNNVLFNLLDSHDTERLMNRLNNLDIFINNLLCCLQCREVRVFTMEQKLQWKVDMTRIAEDVCRGRNLIRWKISGESMRRKH